MALSDKVAGNVYLASEYNELLDLLDVLKEKQLTLFADTATLSDTNSATLGQTDMATNVYPLSYGIFQAGANRTVERLCWITPMEANWDSGNMTAQVLWSAAADSANAVIWSIRAVRIPDNTTLTTAIPEVCTVTDAAGGAYYTRESAVSGAFAITGTGNNILWEVKRSNAAGDTLAASALLIGIKLVYTVA